MAGLKADEYSKFDTMREHVLAIPATYIGSDKPMVRDEYVFDFETKKVKKVSIDIPEGVCRVLIEILSNAGDNEMERVGPNCYFWSTFEWFKLRQIKSSKWGRC